MKLRSAWSNQRGMTLPELVVVCFIMIVLSGVVWGLSRYQLQTFSRESAKAMSQGDLRYWLGRMALDLRRANYDPTGVNSTTNRFTLQTFPSSELTFTTDADGDGTLDTNPVETFGYKVEGGSLKQLQNTSWRTVVTGVTTSSPFTYLDGLGDSFTPDATSTSSRRSIAGVSITLTAQASTGGVAGMAKPTISETIRVGFRNLVF